MYPIVVPTCEEVDKKRKELDFLDPLLSFKKYKTTEKPLGDVESNLSTTSSSPALVLDESSSSINTSLLIVNNDKSLQIPTPSGNQPLTNVSSNPSKQVTKSHPTSSKPQAQKPQLTTIQVNPNQKGNQILSFFNNVRWEFNQEIAMDYQTGFNRGILFLSLKYHRLYTEYILDRLKSLKNSYQDQRILLCHVDIVSFIFNSNQPDHEVCIQELTHLTFSYGFTIVLAWSSEECSRYIEMFCAYQNKPPDSIKEKLDSSYLTRLTETVKLNTFFDKLTAIKSINSTDVLTLKKYFGSLKRISQASENDLLQCPGILSITFDQGLGETKVKQIVEMFSNGFTG